MALASGTTLGVYEITAALGAGGMGEVYRARDTKLGRSVAIKVLPEAFQFDTDRLARFAREARMLASLNHPNIAALHGMEQSEERHFLVMELVEGETLAGTQSVRNLSFCGTPAPCWRAREPPSFAARRGNPSPIPSSLTFLAARRLCVNQ